MSAISTAPVSLSRFFPDREMLLAAASEPVKSKPSADGNAPKNERSYPPIHSISLNLELLGLQGNNYSYPDSVLDTRIKIKNDDGDSMRYKGIGHMRPGIVDGFVGLNLNFMADKLISPGYSFRYPLRFNYVWDYTYNWDDVNDKRGDGEGAEIEAIVVDYPRGIHNPNVHINLVNRLSGDDEKQPLHHRFAIKAGYLTGDVRIIQGKETNSEFHPGKTLYEGTMSGYNVGFIYLRQDGMAPGIIVTGEYFQMANPEMSNSGWVFSLGMGG